MKVGLYLVLGLQLGFSLPVAAKAGMNVLFLAIDDLRPALGCYGDPTAVTPHIDRLAGQGTLFTRAYCQQAVCSPSRMSLMTGRRPDTTRVWDLATHFRKALPEVLTLPQCFRRQGYHTRSFGKIYHGGGAPAKDAPSWSVPPRYDTSRDPALRYASPANLAGQGLKRAASESVDVPDESYLDGLVCEAALAALDAPGEQPFFLAVGFRKPHLPFCAPKRYWDLYARDRIPAPVSTRYPRDAPEWAGRSWKELEGYTDIPRDGGVTPEKVQELRHGYYACVSYVDALVGRLLERLEERQLRENTIVCLWGDHGFHLGEQGLWTKANNYELSARVPLILSVPGQPGGSTSKGLVELVDLYPTLVEACGLECPPGLEGISFMPLLARPDRPWKSAAFTQYPRATQGHRHRGHGDVMGYALRSEWYRYVEWRRWKNGEVLARELYDHRVDPGEMRNLASSPEQLKHVKQLAAKLRAGWQEALPGR